MSTFRNVPCRVPYFISHVTRPHVACRFYKISMSLCRFEGSRAIQVGVGKAGNQRQKKGGGRAEAEMGGGERTWGGGGGVGKGEWTCFSDHKIPNQVTGTLCALSRDDRYHSPSTEPLLPPHHTHSLSKHLLGE